jgi:hypothetical protein
MSHDFWFGTFVEQRVHVLEGHGSKLSWQVLAFLMHFLQNNCRLILSLRGHPTLPVFVISVLSCNSIINTEDSI